jgi:hypothetical protein
MIHNDCEIKSGVCMKNVSEIVYRRGNLYHACWKCARALKEEIVPIPNQRDEQHIIRHEEVP